MRRESHVQFCQGRFPGATHLVITSKSKELLEGEVKPLVGWDGSHLSYQKEERFGNAKLDLSRAIALVKSSMSTLVATRLPPMYTKTAKFRLMAW